LNTVRRLGIALIFVVSCIVIDRVTKSLAIEYLTGSAPITYLGGLITLQHTENLGAFLGLGARLPASVRLVMGIGVPSVLVLASGWYVITTYTISTAQLISLSCLIGGGIGNLIDRIWNQGAVTDFVMFGLGPLHTGILNVADIAVTFGALAFAWLGFRESSAEQSDVSKEAES
jgi:signal peptidase II